jgi:predicted CXXCH cytochrome family protein
VRRRLVSVTAPLASIACALLVAWALLGAGEARAQLFSPGTLSRAHGALNGVGACGNCHVEGARHDNTKCIACHTEIGKRLDAGTGYHSSVRERQCAECHREHRGENANLIEWSPSREKFNHANTGWPLKGEHKKQECKTCHELRRVGDEEVRNLVQKKARETFLGVGTECYRCHFDEHRGQEGKSCERCHTADEKFAKAPLFSHNDKSMTRYPLTGKHRGVDCKNCHETLADTSTPADSFPKPLDASYWQMKEVPHAQCSACHEDVHRGAFGRSCDKCHVTDGWSNIKQGAQDTGFHDKYRFPLKGEHKDVACNLCHGPFPNGQAAKYKGMKFERCSDCHVDAHEGQVPAEGDGVKCEKCHTVNGFLPVLFTVDMHKDTRFPLEGAHRAVACNRCHKQDSRLSGKVANAARARVNGQGRRLIVSEAKLTMDDIVGDPLEEKRGITSAATADCAGCHEDIHAGQFNKNLAEEGSPKVDHKSCSACHSMGNFTDTTFKHDDSRFPLTGKHQQVKCAQCHQPSKAKGPMFDVVVYRGIGVQCGSCHADVHVGQLAKAAAKEGAQKDDKPVTDCASCHGTTSFKPAKFDHDKQSSFPLEGEHKRAKCESCHQVINAKGYQVARYKPLPNDCVGCHVDEHKRAFDDFNPKSAAPEHPELVERKEGKSACEGCHNSETWMPAKFAHERTGFELTGRHALARCAACHGNTVERRLGATCAACHVDPHAQEFGLHCQSCHDTTKFRAPTFPVDAHRRTNFPLVGRHAALPCDECHVEKRENQFGRAALDCTFCHALDVLKASIVTVDHSVPPFAGKSCGNCHVPNTFTPAQFAAHEKCFPLSHGSHAPFRCAECHSNLAGARFTGTCRGQGVTCAECHDHSAEIEDRRHAKVAGYQHQSAKCAACHPPG